MGIIRRAKISKGLADRLADALANSKSVVVIGPRHAGKTYLFNRITESLLKDYELQSYMYSFYRDYPIQNEEEVADILRMQISRISSSAKTVSAVFRDFKKISQAQGRPIILLLTHLDGIASHIARKILREIRPAVTTKPPSVIVLLSGASNIVDLVRGPDSEFNCSYEYFVQGFDREFFAEFFIPWIGRVGVQFDSAKKACEHIWKLTNGNTSLCRRFLLSWVNNLVTGTSQREKPLAREGIDIGFQRLVSLGIHGAMTFQWAAEMISARPDCWRDLSKLIEQGRVGVKGHEPHTLELAGAAEFRNGELFFASPVMKAFLLKQFGLRQRADLFAQIGKWEEAFARYKKAGPGYPRPANFQDEFVVGTVTRRLCSAFADVDLAHLDRYVTQGVRGLLGFGYASWWHENGNTGWSGPKDHLREDQKLAIKTALAEIKMNNLGKVVHVGNIGLAVPVPGDIPGEHKALVVADLGNSAEIGKHRRAFLHEILKTFSLEYSEKLKKLRQQRQQDFAHGLTEIATKAYADLFINSGNPADVIHSATNDMLDAQLGFTLVFCAMVDGQDHELKVTSAYPPREELRTRKWQLNQKSVVTDCYHEGSQWVGPGGSPWPALDLEWMQEHEMHAAVAVRLLGEGGACTGVLCVIYGTETLPDRDEVRTLNEFAGQLSAALQQSHRVALLQSALDRIPEPIVLFDQTICKKYANAPAVLMLRVSPGWNPDHEPPPTSALGLLLPQVRDSWAKKHRLVDFPGRIGEHAYQGAILTDALMESERVKVEAEHAKSKPIGALLHIQDENYYRQILDAYRSLEQSRDEIEILYRLQTIFQEMGHRWIRKYRVRGDELVLESWIDSGEPQIIPSLTLPKRDADLQVTWRSVVEARPFVFCWDKTRKFGEQFYTSRGLHVIAAPQPPGAELLPKEPGDYWIDFPLMRSKENVFGKLTLPCEETLSPEHFDMFRVFSDVAGDIFKRMSELTQAISSRERRLIAENMARNFRTEVSASVKPLDVTLALYKTLEMQKMFDEESLARINQQFYQGLVNLRGVIETLRVQNGGTAEDHEGNQ